MHNSFFFFLTVFLVVKYFHAAIAIDLRLPVNLVKVLIRLARFHMHLLFSSYTEHFQIDPFFMRGVER